MELKELLKLKQQKLFQNTKQTNQKQPQPKQKPIKRSAGRGR